MDAGAQAQRAVERTLNQNDGRKSIKYKHMMGALSLTAALTIAAAAAHAEFDLTAYVWPQDNTEHVVYLGKDQHIHELWLKRGVTGWNHNDLTLLTGAPAADLGIAAYVWPFQPSGVIGQPPIGDDSEHVFFQGRYPDLDLHEFWLKRTGGGWRHNDLSADTGTKCNNLETNLTGYVWFSDDTEHVACVSPSGHVYEFWLKRTGGGWHANDLSADTGATLPPVPGAKLSGGVWPDDKSEHVFYEGSDAHLHHLWLQVGVTGWVHQDLTADFAAISPTSRFSFYIWIPETGHLIWGGVDAHVHELSMVRGTGVWTPNDLTAESASPPLPTPGPTVAAYVWPDDESEHVIYYGADTHMHELWLKSGVPGWHHHDLTADLGLPPNSGQLIACYVWPADSSQHIIFTGTGPDPHIFELSMLRGTGVWHLTDLTAATGAPPIYGSL
jgi:hypothetical protein